MLRTRLSTREPCGDRQQPNERIAVEHHQDRGSQGHREAIQVERRSSWRRCLSALVEGSWKLVCAGDCRVDIGTGQGYGRGDCSCLHVATSANHLGHGKVGTR